MHHCLCVDEILRQVASELVGSKWKATAAAFARCCQSFEDPVLSILWEAQVEGLAPLLTTLPGDVWDSRCDSFKRLPTELEWARFRGYARKIRTFKEYHPSCLPSQVLLVLRFHAFNEPFLPNLRYLELTGVDEDFAPIIPLFLSPKTTSIHLEFKYNFPTAVVASTVITLPMLCPNLQRISLSTILIDPVITAAVSEMVLAIKRNTLRKFGVNSPLTEEAAKVLCELSDLRELWLTIDRLGSLPVLVLPNLTEIQVSYNYDHGWLQGFCGATLGKLTSVIFDSLYGPTDDFLEAFESVALTTSIPTTLSKFAFSTLCPFRPNYRSLLPFTQLEQFVIEFPCSNGCSSTIDDDIVADLARAMPKLEVLCIGRTPCKTPTGVTAKGLAALAHYCLRLSSLCIHFQVAGLDPSVIPEAAPSGESTMTRKDCALTCLHVGSIPLPEESISMVTRTLLRIFPRLDDIIPFDQSWNEVGHMIRVSHRLADHPRTTLEGAIQS